MRHSTIRMMVILAVVLLGLVVEMGCQTIPSNSSVGPDPNRGGTAPAASAANPAPSIARRAASSLVGVCLTVGTRGNAGTLVHGWLVSGPSEGWFVLKRPSSDASRHILVPSSDSDAASIAQSVDGRAQQLGQGRGDHIVVAGDPGSARYQQVVNALLAKNYVVYELDTSGLKAEDVLTSVADAMEQTHTRVATIITESGEADARKGSGGRRKTPKRPKRPRRPRRQRDFTDVHLDQNGPLPPGFLPGSPPGAPLPGGVPVNSVGGIDLSEMTLSHVSGRPSGPAQGEFGEIYRAPCIGASARMPGIHDRAGKLQTAFKIGLALNPSQFWVNLNPTEPNRITDPLLAQTDIGRIMLEADLMLKKDTSAIIDPRQSEAGKEYWRRLAEAAGGARSIRQQTRVWIVPGTIEVSESGDDAVVEYADLVVKSETEYKEYKEIHSSGARPSLSSSDRLFTEMILPRLAERVNNAPEYAPLRAIYNSLILARWYRDHYRRAGGAQAAPIDTGSVEGLESRTKWSQTEIWQQYKESAEKGDYDFVSETPVVVNGMRATQSTRYFSGGVDFTNLACPEPKPIEPKTAALLEAAWRPEGALHGGDVWFSEVAAEGSDPQSPGLQPTGSRPAEAAEEAGGWKTPVVALGVMGMVLAVILWSRRRQAH